MRRRAFLAGMGAAGGAGLSGCPDRLPGLAQRSASVAWTWSDAAVEDVAATPRRVHVATDAAVLALSVADGSVVWETDLAAQTVHTAEGVVVCDAEDGTETVGLDAATGERRWTRRDGLFSWPNPDTAVLDGDRFRGVDPRSGDVHWTVSGDGNWRAVAADAERVYAVVERDDGADLRAFDRDAGTERWRTPLAPGDLWSGAVLGGRLVLGTDRADPHRGRVAAFDPASGERLWGTDLGRTLPAPAPAAAVSGHVAVEQFVTDGRGDTCVLDAASGRRTWCRADQRFLAADDERVVVEREPGKFAGRRPDGTREWTSRMEVIISHSTLSGEMVTPRLWTVDRERTFVSSFAGSNVVSERWLETGERTWRVAVEEPFDRLVDGHRHVFAVGDRRVSAVRLEGTGVPTPPS